MRGVLGLGLILGGFALVILMLTGHLTFPGVNAPASSTTSSASTGQPQSPGTPPTVSSGAATGGSGAGGGF